MSYSAIGLFPVCLAALLIMTSVKESQSDSTFPALDHIILGAADLNTGVKQLEELTGVSC